jgi:hypothetical protein
VSAAPAPALPEPKFFGLRGSGGTLVLYHQGTVNHCPGCGWSQWHIGRVVAECVRCCAAIPLVTPVAPSRTLEDAS